ncbi:DUF2971 domain-containing protein [Aromatoleum buckelii]|uniref:DUF2971 domain-containing protein n=1 Tax=Aromatoleum buckelii TaxID=200254 RepID=A0ABX1N7J7_9RHOO|nr:DUF2971 domain-containing protein [Aromatoleum buckelii]MCK0509571.1 DUF2971 domain-containing protein [Aromatoleum buckelii]
MNFLYHYTSLNGILGILSSRRIWATHASYLNDASEFFHGLSFAKQLAGGIFMEDDYLAAFGWAVRHGLEAVSADELYVASFSEKADLLSQWRGYCPAGAGLCLGFDVDQLRTFCQGKGYRLEQCIYEHREQIQQVEDLVSKCFEGFPKPRLTRCDFENLDSKSKVDAEINYRLRTSEGSEKPQADAAIERLCAEITEIAPLFKNQGFHEEAEWRIVARHPEEPTKFRTASSYLAPYVELEVLSEPAESALREVIIGPNPNQRRCESSVKMLLASFGLSEVEVKTSPLPFNSW